MYHGLLFRAQVVSLVGSKPDHQAPECNLFPGWSTHTCEHEGIIISHLCSLWGRRVDSVQLACFQIQAGVSADSQMLSLFSIASFVYRPVQSGSWRQQAMNLKQSSMLKQV